jgi:ribosomal protein L32
MDLRETVEFKEFGFNIVICPNCGNETLDSHYICPNCGWEYDDLPTEYSSCNKNN